MQSGWKCLERCSLFSTLKAKRRSVPGRANNVLAWDLRHGFLAAAEATKVDLDNM